VILGGFQASLSWRRAAPVRLLPLARCGGPRREVGRTRTRSSMVEETAESAWVHAYLHRVFLSKRSRNAMLLYPAAQSAGGEMIHLKAEWERILVALFPRKPPPPVCLDSLGVHSDATLNLR